MTREPRAPNDFRATSTPHRLTLLHRPAPPSPRSEGDDDEIDLRALFGVVWRGKWIIAVTTVIALVFAFLYVSQLEPSYRASTRVMFGLAQSNVVDIEQVVVSSAIREDTLQNEIEVLTSTSLIERVIDQLRLERSPEFNPSLREEDPGVLDALRSLVSLPEGARDLLMSLGVLKPPPPPPDPIEVARRERLSIIQNVRGGLSLRPIRGSKVIEISFTSGNPRTAAAIANEVADQYIVDQLDAKLEATRTATDWLTERVDELRLRVQAAEEAVELALADLSLTSGQSLEITQQQLKELNGALTVARGETSQSRSRYDRLVSALAEGRDLGAIPEFRESGIVQTYREQITEMRSREAAIASEVPEGHPARVRLVAQIAEVEANMASEAERIVQAALTDLETRLANEEALVIQVRELETKALDQSREQVRVRQLEREAEASRALYENFLARLKETTEQDELQSADARVLTPAEQPLSPLSQSRNRILMLGGMLGLMAGIGIVFLLNHLNNTFRSAGQLEALTGENVLGVVPSIGRRIFRADVMGHFRKNPKSALAEAVRSLRTSILFTNVDAPPKVIMFTSSVPREGKSTTSMLTAVASQQMGKSAVIVDCDLRLPALARLLDTDDQKPGLLSVLEGSATLSEAIFTDPQSGLNVLMTRPSEPRSNVNAADILSSHKFGALIAELRAKYDLVVLDTPPVLVVADARIIAAQADAIVYVVGWDRTPRDAVREGLKELRSVNAPIAGVALTLVDEARASRYAYDGYSYYKGRYRDYYVS